MSSAGLTRRRVLQAAGGAALTAMAGAYQPWLARAASVALRKPDSLPDPSRPAGTATDALPFDHIVCLMQENHSFDNYFGMLPRRGQPKADGFTFDAHGVPLNSNPLGGGIVRVQHATSVCQPVDITQAWTPTHQEIDHGRMDGFAKVDQGQMLYYDEADIPFYYSLANTFCVGNRWFCSAPCQTYPNRRFYLAGTAFGLISTDNSSVTQSPPNGTLFDRLNQYGISWKDYYVDVPGTAVILEIPEKNPANMAPIGQFYSDCAAGTLPAVSFVDPEIGVLNSAGSALAGQIPAASGPSNQSAAQDQDEENPADIQLGESFIHDVVQAVLSSPLWPRTLIVWIYDEHGGYYDHVPPPAAIAPDNIPPALGPHDYPGGYNLYGPRIPSVVASPYAKANGTTGVLHDHTSVLATIQAKWNLPAMTYRDANATTVADFLDLGRAPALLEPPPLAGPGDVAGGEEHCDTSDPTLKVLPAPALFHVGRLIIEFLGRRRHNSGRGVYVELHTSSGTLSHLSVSLVRDHHTYAHAAVATVGTHRKRVLLHSHHLAAGHYTLVVRRRGRVLLRRRVHVGT